MIFCIRVHKRVWLVRTLEWPDLYIQTYSKHNIHDIPYTYLEYVYTYSILYIHAFT